MNIIKDRNIHIENPETKTFLADCFYPAKEGQFPLLIFVHGYKGYKDWGTFDLMGQMIAEEGFVFVKFNFSHNGTTLDNPKEFGDLEAFGLNNYSKEMSDYNAVIDYFTQHPKVDADNIFIMGHSRGGGNTILQSSCDSRVKGLITLASVNNFETRFPKKDRLKEFEKNGVFYVENARTKQQMPHYYQFYEDFIAHKNDFDIQRAAQHLQKPFLIIHGTKDEVVNYHTAELLNQWSKNSELILIENGTHTFGGQEPWLLDDLTEDLDKVVRSVVNYLHKNS